MQRTAFLDDVEKLLERGTAWAGLGGDAAAFAIARVARKGRWLVLVDQEDRAERLTRALEFFHPHALRVVHYPADDNKPYDGFSPDPSLPRRRLRALDRVSRGKDVVLVASAPALMQRVPDLATRQRGVVELEVGEEYDRKAIIEKLTHGGYLSTAHVEGPGQLAVRGDVIDVWPADRHVAVRIDWFDEEIESIRAYDPSARTIGRGVQRLAFLPAREERLDDVALDRLHAELTRHVSEQGRGVQLRRRVYEELKAGVRFSAVEDWLPALVPTVDPLQELADLTPLCVLPDDVQAAARDLEREALRRWQALEDDERPLVPPTERYTSADRICELARAAHPILGISGREGAADLGAIAPDGFAVHGSELAPVVRRIEHLAADSCRVALVVQDGKRAGRLQELLEPHGLMPKIVGDPMEIPRGKVSLVLGDLPQGFVAEDSGWAILPATALFGGGARRARRQERIHTLFEAGVTSMAQLKVGDPVVHRLHGIGKYLGLQRLEIQGEVHRAKRKKAQQDFVKLEYKGGGLLFLPVTDLAKLSKYTPATGDAKVTLDRLGGQTWANRKGKVRDSLLKMADDLLRLYARRENATRDAWPEPGSTYRAFEARFPYTETPDQATAIEAVQADLSEGYPMDRLLCGDVGFGKTEVALRAAMRVVEGGGQVAVLCPTTVLAFQHLQRFRERFAEFPVNIAMLSRFNDAAEDKRVRSGLADGSIDVVVGTTALLGRQVRYKRLGLMVIDEEHRFGVKQKDRLKRMRAQVDILSMSATPIPRTLRMALSGLREMSIMATPPAQRLAVRTTVAQLSEARVRDAITTEIARGGQVFVIHNRVETIGRFADRLRRWVPDARFAVAHGQMEEGELEGVLVDFVQKQHDVLVCTAIVESGVDIPSVNTMLVHRADLFGLSQLYQLRGRVGRSDVRASCILLVPDEITRDARKRLRVLVEHTQLGSGFHVAAADLELRGGGNLLGAAQSGNIDKVGYETWVELLRLAVHRARGELEVEQIDPEVEVPIDAFIPDQLVPDPQKRLGWYQRIGAAATPGAVEKLLDDLEADVGELPPEVRNLGGLTTIRLLCREWGVVRCSWLKVRAVFAIHEASRLLGGRLEQAAARHPKRFSIKKGKAGLVLDARFTPREAERPFRYLRWVFAQLSREDV